LHDIHSVEHGGEVATYIPELGNANPDEFGICLTSVSGQTFEVGATATAFTIQSISKPLLFAMALDEHGRDAVLRKVGVEPTGEAFNAIVLDEATNRPFNPMVNAGAIATCALIGGANTAERWQRVLDTFSRAAGQTLRRDDVVYESERAIMGATLANLGTNPITGEEVFGIDAVRDTLSVMLTCGMYDYSGEWVFRVGVPAKSGVSGGVLGVVNRQLGMGLYSPRLDHRGNSVRGVRACVDIAAELGLHAFDFLNHGSAFLQSLDDAS